MPHDSGAGLRKRLEIAFLTAAEALHGAGLEWDEIEALLQDLEEAEGADDGSDPAGA